MSLIDRVNNKLRVLGCRYEVTDAYGLRILDDNIKSIIVPDIVRNLNGEEFLKCYGQLEEVIFSDNSNVKSIPHTTFRNCMKLVNVKLPLGLRRIEHGAFENCSSLEKIELPNNLYKIGDRAFMKCESLESIIIPNSVKSVGDDAFMGCIELRYASIGNSVEYMGDGVFRYCSNLKDINLGSSIKDIGDKCFQGTDLDSLYIPDSVTDIGKGIVSGIDSIKDIVYGKGLKHIGDINANYAIKLCVKLPKEIVTIENGDITTDVDGLEYAITGLLGRGFSVHEDEHYYILKSYY